MELQQCINERRSVRKYKLSHISNENIKTLIESAQKAPSWKNSQVSRYYAINTLENKEKFKEFLPEFNQNNTENAGAYIVTTVVNKRSGFDRDGNYSSHLKDGFQYFDNGLQVENLCLTAHDMGFGTLIMGLYDEKGIRDFLQIPETEIIVCVISVGVPDINPTMPQRKNVEDIVKFY
ncbi:MAG: nitroreductase family protein [Clostridia bacterium]|nr:nitroreductase family protein [Clostridia bacterium]